MSNNVKPSINVFNERAFLSARMKNKKTTIKTAAMSLKIEGEPKAHTAPALAEFAEAQKGAIKVSREKHEWAGEDNVSKTSGTMKGDEIAFVILGNAGLLSPESLESLADDDAYIASLVNALADVAPNANLRDKIADVLGKTIGAPDATINTETPNVNGRSKTKSATK